MPDFKLVISNPKDGSSKTVTLSGDQSTPLVGLKIGDTIEGELVGSPGVKLRITGGSDKSGSPMRPYLSGGVKRKILLAGSPGFNPSQKGERMKKMVRGSIITDDMVQINMQILASEGAKAEAK